ncbi:carboxymethylenebutenolidase homolog [Halichoeres trimaculatus]|uniref:carboxymethylenebutenolidase homolog n=1 Tax=Halichoeres trimaculatus TaxID=147232 RepID=UPI003D9DCBCB
MANEANPCPCDIGDRMEYGGLGEEVQIEHLKAYVVKPSTPSDKAIIVIQDIYGWELSNTRYIAEKLAANGYIAVCPDFFVGKEPWTPSHDWSIFTEWLKERSPTDTQKEVDAVLRFLKQQCGAKNIGAVGFCWGGIVTHYLALNYPEIKAGVSMYGIIRDREDRYGLKFPVLFIFGDNDSYIPLDQVHVLEAKLKENCTMDHQVKIFPGQTHGFVHRKNEDMNPEDKPSILEARADLLNWLKKYM